MAAVGRGGGVAGVERGVGGAGSDGVTSDGTAAGREAEVTGGTGGAAGDKLQAVVVSATAAPIAARPRTPRRYVTSTCRPPACRGIGIGSR